MKRLLSLILMFFIAGCSFIPEYKRPEPPIRDRFSKDGFYKHINYKKELQSLKWEEFILDNKLKQIIKLALKNNRDLKLAVLNMEKARALYGIKEKELYPTLYASSGWEKQRIPDDMSLTKKAYISEKYSVNLGISNWEIDFFGRIRSLKKEALENFLAEVENRRAAQISLINEISRAYLFLSMYVENKDIVAGLLDVAQKNLRLVESQYKVGVATEMDLNRAKTAVESLKVEMLKVDEQIEKGKNALNLLVGKEVDERLLPESLLSIRPFEEFFPTISSYVLLNRPDIMAMEHRLKAGYADIGAARAAFFPRISLTTGIGTISDEFSNLFKGSARTWNYSITGALPVLDLKVWQDYKLSKIQRKILLTQYEKTIQNAFWEVMDKLVVMATIDEQIKARQRVISCLNENYKLALERFKKGVDSYFSVLDSYKNLLAEKQALLNLIFVRYENQIGLFAAFGGGGDVEKSHYYTQQ